MNYIEINEDYQLRDFQQCDLFHSDDPIHVYGKVNTNFLMDNLAQTDPAFLQIGVDEVGRGTLLGNVVISAIILPKQLTGELAELDLTNTPLAGLNDSKKLTQIKRKNIYQQLQDHAVGYVCVQVPPSIIDSINILQATLQGMRIAVYSLLKHIQDQSSSAHIDIVIDGNKMPQLDLDQYHQWGYNSDTITAMTVIKGDGKLSSIAAAGVMAKVTRDNEMYQLASQYPQYQIEKHKGYPTKAHISVLQEFGIIDEIYRTSFKPVAQLLTVDK